MFSRYRYLILALCWSSTLYATPHTSSGIEQRLSVRIDELLKKRQGEEHDGNVVQLAKLLTPARQLAAICPDPVLSLAGNDTRLTGKRSVIAQCGARRHYLQIQISAHGSWWVAKKNLPVGSVIRAEDIESHTGSLDHQPAGILFDINQIVGQTTTRALNAGSPIVQNQLRQQWLLHAGQMVDIITQGDGFRIRSQGKALANASVDDMLKVQTRTGRTISGKVAHDGQVEILLQQ
ncbi:flagellar basal body P-ring formation chaperone FlgA [Erwinia pyrifoliae]|uniref:Flagella basal body P-ring formation protein FlgA n=1 Tax=Erwinia pyrifoliae TaxID=79967 RepID=A0ABY5XAF7_ERWPY|nr:flagellar basal body P-ring formation chaperone FlgA [Erwinia pyrifoliae]UWS34341.1 flagellar basal body P-ring formation chaperone FlgA [Erwinia pyrifoliae]